MRKFTAVALAAMMVLTIFASIMPASAVVESVEIRGPVYNGTDLDDPQIVGPADTDFIEMNATNFAGFYYDLDADVSTEVVRVFGGDLTGERTIEEKGLEYNTTITEVEYEATFEADLYDHYPILGLFAEDFVPVNNETPDVLLKLLEDNDDKYTLRTGQVLELAGGYELVAKQIDVEGDKVWMEFSKDGVFIEDEVVDVTEGEATWVYDTTVEDEEDVEILRVHITDVFQGQVDSLAIVEGLWLVDEANVLTVETGDEFGILELDAITTSLVMTNTDTLTLTADSVENIAEGMNFKVADSDDLRFYLMEEITEPGTYEIRGEVVEDVAGTWDYTNFAGFFYDLDEDIATEVLTVVELNVPDREIDENNLTYVTTIQEVEYEAAFEADLYGKYPVLGLFAEEYTPLKNDTPDLLAKLLVDDDTKYTLRTGQSLELANGYAVTPLQIDVEGDKVWVEFTHDGVLIDDEVIDVTAGEATWVYDDTVEDEDDVEILRLHITDVFQGQVDSLAIVEGVWLMDFKNVLVVETGDEFGNLELDTVGANTLEMSNPDAITLTADSTESINNGMKFRIADDDEVRYFPFVEVTIGVPVVEVPVEEVPEEVPVEEVPEEVPVEEVPEEVPVEEVPEEVPVEEVPEEPGFEAIFAIAGLLAVAYLVRRN